VKPTPDSLRADAATVVWHMPAPPDGCDCPTAPCGKRIVHGRCGPHQQAMATLAMSIHPADRCPAGAS
jgi:hypothetical protein